jgi:hypothetical protein
MNDRVDNGTLTPDVLVVTLDHANYSKNVQFKTKKLDMVEHF